MFVAGVTQGVRPLVTMILCALRTHQPGGGPAITLLLIIKLVKLLKSIWLRITGHHNG